MPRLDLITLSPDDLATLANRGLVKRAQSELEGGAVTYTLSENAAGTVSILWSDDIHCLLPSNAPLQNAQCSCAAMGLCRHLIRSVLAYQREHPAQADATEAETITEIAEDGPEQRMEAPTEGWNPGEVSDSDLEKLIPSTTLNRARKIWESGLVIEATQSSRPSAWFYTLGVNLRFLVPNDVRYTHCECAEAAPCIHTALAVWAFRELAPEASNGLISTRATPLPVPTSLLDGIEEALSELAQAGVAGLSQPSLDKLNRLESQCRTQGLVWPAEVVADLAKQVEMHAAHNARFEPVRVAQLVGELLIRCDAIRSQTGAVPDVFVRGSASDKSTEVGAARLVGIGTRASPYPGGVELSAFLQDTDSGAVVVISRDFPDPKNDDHATFLRAASLPSKPQQFWKLATSPVMKGVGLGSLGSGQVLARGGKRAPNGIFSFGRTPLSFNFQNFEWEKLRSPLLSEGFAPIEAHLSHSAPTVLRPRRAGENVYVVPIAGVEGARFLRAEQEVQAICHDGNGGHVLLKHPFLARGSEGIDALLATLESASNLRFLSGHFQKSAQGLAVAPLALILEHDTVRTMVQPWVGQPTASPVRTADSEAIVHEGSGVVKIDPLRDFRVQLMEALGELLLIGLQRADERIAGNWGQVKRHGTSVGFSRMLAPIERIEEELVYKSKVRHWDSQQAILALFQVVVIALLAAEMG